MRLALIGFGIDSVIEVSSGVALLWRLHMDHHVHRREQTEARALKLVGLSFVALAAYVAYDAISSLVRKDAPEESFPGIVLAALSLIAMPILARAKRRVAAEITSRALQADARQTDICAYLSAILLAGLALNATLGWWWADPVAALAMTPIIAKEGREALREWLATPVSPFAMDFEAMIRLFIAPLGTKEQIVTTLEQVLEDAHEMLRFGGAVKQEFLEGIAVTQDQVYIRALAVDFFISHLRTVEAWACR